MWVVETLNGSGTFHLILWVPVQIATSREGLAREFVRRIQDLRKSAGLEISDRIDIVYQASAELAQAIEENREYIANETLALSLASGSVSEDYSVLNDSFDGETVTIGLCKAR